MELLTERSARIATARKLTRRAGRDAAGLFLAEGRQAVVEALADPDGVREVFASEAAAAASADLLAGTAVPVRLVTDKAAASLSETVTPQGLVAVCALRDVPADRVVQAPPRLAVALAELNDPGNGRAAVGARGDGPADGGGQAPPGRAVALAELNDPGNGGTVLRTADACGAGAVVFGTGSADPYGGKVVRASAGSLFHVDVVRSAPLEPLLPGFRAAGVTVLAADGGGAGSLDALAADGTVAGP